MRKLFFVIILCCTGRLLCAYDFDPNDFAVEVIEYVQGGAIPPGGFGDPVAALGRPTVDTTYLTDETAPVVPVFPAQEDGELVSIGNGGHLVLKFGRKVYDDINNPYGIDFIVFGNCFQKIGNDQEWINRDPTQIVIGTTSLNSEPGTVSVAQYSSGPWYSYNDGPYADGFAPTLGRIFDTVDPDPNVGEWNLWWGEPTDPTKPVDPDMTTSDLSGKTVAQAAELYGVCAGGAGFDLHQSGFDWVRYIKIQNNNEYETPEIDAVTDVDPGSCGDQWHPYPPGDLSENCVVDLYDLQILSSNWLNATWVW